MTAPERKMKHFDANAPRCKAHGERPSIHYDGTWLITCADLKQDNDGEVILPEGFLKGACLLIDAEHAEPDELMMRWDQGNK